MVHKTLSTLVWRSHGSPLSAPLKDKSQQTKSCIKGKNKRICNIKSTNLFFRHIFDINSGIPSTQQRVRESDDLKLNPLYQERNNKEQVINHNKDNINGNKINGKPEIVLIIISKTLITNSTMKDTDNLKKIINNNLDMESNKQIKRKCWKGC